MKYISLNEIVDCNAWLKEKNLAFRIHLRDACGKQSCWIEPLGNCACDGRWDEMYGEIEGFFHKLGYQLIFDRENLSFWVDQSE